MSDDRRRTFPALPADVARVADQRQAIPTVIDEPLDPWREAVVERVIDANGDPLRALARTYLERVARIGLTQLPNHVVQLLADGTTLAAAYLAETDGKGGPGRG